MIDLLSEKLISFRDAIELVPNRRAGRPLNIATLYRWTSEGVRGVRLEFINAGGSRVTSREALQRFFDRLTADQSSGHVSLPPASRQREIDTAKRELIASGFDLPTT